MDPNVALDPNALWAMISGHRWVPIAALVIGLVVRLLKSDTKIPITIPPRLRFWLAFGLGAVSGVLEAVITGTPWGPAITGGLVSSVLAVLGQNAIIDSLRGGKELVVPGAIIPGAVPAPGKPVSLKPPSMDRPTPPGGLATVFLFLACFGGLSAVLESAACLNKVQQANLAEYTAKKVECAVANQDLSTEAMLAKCLIDPSDIPQILAIVGESRRQAAAKMERAEKAGLCKQGASLSDGGVQ